jgi:hypothetical protein
VSLPDRSREAGLVLRPRPDLHAEVEDGVDEQLERERDEHAPNPLVQRPALAAHERSAEEEARAAHAEQRAEQLLRFHLALGRDVVVERPAEIEHAPRGDEHEEEPDGHAQPELRVVRHQEERAEAAHERGDSPALPAEGVAAREERFLVLVALLFGRLGLRLRVGRRLRSLGGFFSFCGLFGLVLRVDGFSSGSHLGWSRAV